MKNKIFILFLLSILNINNTFASGPNICNTYSCGACCSQDSKPCCNPGVRPRLVAPTQTITSLSRTYKHKAVTPRSSSITISESDITGLMTVGNSQLTLQTSTYTDSTIMNIGVADDINAQSWVIPNDVIGKLTWSNNLDFINETDVPTDATTLQPTASHWAKETVTRDGEAYTTYHFLWLNPGSHIELMGKVFVRNSDGQVFSNNNVISGSYTDVDIQLGKSFPIYSTYVEPNNTNFNNYTHGNITFDGYGTITTPFGTFDCLRASIMQESQLYDAVSGMGIGVPDTSYWAAWFTKEGFRFYGRKSEESSSGNITLKNLQIQRIIPTSVLPVELLSFSVQKIDNQKVKIDWVTASEKNNAAFEVQRSTDGKNFKTISVVKGMINSTQKQCYTILDEAPSVGHNYYRLRQIDTEGTEAISKVEYVWITPEKGFLNIYPNPTHETLTVEFEKATNMVIINTLGQIVKDITLNELPYLQSQNISITDLQNGVYFLKANIGGEVKTVQFVKN